MKKVQVNELGGMKGKFWEVLALELLHFFDERLSEQEVHVTQLDFLDKLIWKLQPLRELAWYFIQLSRPKMKVQVPKWVFFNFFWRAFRGLVIFMMKAIVGNCLDVKSHRGLNQFAPLHFDMLSR